MSNVIEITSSKAIDTSAADSAADVRLDKRVRAKARRQGFVVCKSRSRTPEHPDYGRYHILNGHTGNVEAGCHLHGFQMTLAQVAAWVDGEW